MTVSLLWTRIDGSEKIGEEELHAALEATEDNLNASEATRSLLGFARVLLNKSDDTCAELVVGGEGSSSLTQIIIAAGNDGELDILATAVAVNESSREPTPCCSARGRVALTLIASYWSSYPKAPLLLIPTGKRPQRVLATLQGLGWTTAPMTAAHLGQLRVWAKSEPDARVAFMIDFDSSCEEADDKDDYDCGGAQISST
jgi:hypothetical protein